MKASLIIFFIHSGHIVLLSAHVQNTTNRFIFPVSFYFDGYFNAYYTHIRMLSGALILGKLFYSFDPSAPLPLPHSKTIKSEKTTKIIFL